MVYELSVTMFTTFAYVVLAWTAIMALFIVGTTLWQLRETFGATEIEEPTQMVGGDD